MTDRVTATASSPQDRRIRIELLRLRAHYQRLELRHSACQLASDLQPKAIAAQVRDGLGAAGLGWLGSGLTTLRRFPLLLSLASTLLSGVRRRRVLLKLALIGGLVWLGRQAAEKPVPGDDAGT